MGHRAGIFGVQPGGCPLPIPYRDSLMCHRGVFHPCATPAQRAARPSPFPRFYSHQTCRKISTSHISTLCPTNQAGTNPEFWKPAMPRTGRDAVGRTPQDELHHPIAPGASSTPATATVQLAASKSITRPAAPHGARRCQEMYLKKSPRSSDWGELLG